MLLSITLSRRPSTVDVHDAPASRAHLLGMVREEVLLHGQPHPRLVLLGDGFEETLDLDAMAREQPHADPGATLQALARRPGIFRRFAVVLLLAETHDGEQRILAGVVEVIDGDEPGEDVRFWAAALPFRRDEVQQLGHPTGDWQQGEGSDLQGLLPALRPLISPPTGARAAVVSPPRFKQPDIKMTFGAVDPRVPLPEDARALADLVSRMVTPHVLKDGIPGTIVLRFHGRDWEWWVLGLELPTDLDDMVRTICQRDPPADAAAIVLASVFQGVPPPQKGLQIVAQHGRLRAERWSLLAFPSGPGGAPVVERQVGRDLTPAAEGEGWLGVEPMIDFELGPLNAGEA